LGIFIVRAPVFRCSLEHAKRSFYRAANGIFGKIGRIASEEVTIQLLKSKWYIPLLLYAFEVCNLTKRDLQSLDFTINRVFVKLFRTSDINVVTECQLNFHFQLPSVLLENRRENLSMFMERCDGRL